MTTTASSPFVVMAKPVGSHCNLRCGYCYYLKTEALFDNYIPSRMPDDLLETFIRQYIDACPDKVVRFTWHGGEPALAGLDFYRRAIAFQQKYLSTGRSCWNSLQTNGLLLDDKWCEFLAEAKFDVGLSLDGTKEVHDRFRRTLGGAQGTYDQAIQAVHLLQKHGIQPDLLCTVNAETVKDPLAVYRALRDLRTGWIQFIPIVCRTDTGQVTPESVTGKDYGAFLCAIFDEWISHDLGRVDVQLFAETAGVWSGGSPGLCWMAPTCGRVLIVEHDGEVYACDHFVSPAYRLGNLVSDDLGALADARQQLDFGENKKRLLPPECLACPWLNTCNGGCPKDRFAQDQSGNPNLNYLCAGLKAFFAHADQPIRHVIALGKRGFGPEAIMAEMRANLKAKWRGIGRNDPCPCGSGLKAKRCCWDKRIQ